MKNLIFLGLGLFLFGCGEHYRSDNEVIGYDCSELDSNKQKQLIENYISVLNTSSTQIAFDKISSASSNGKEAESLLQTINIEVKSQLCKPIYYKGR